MAVVKKSEIWLEVLLARAECASCLRVDVGAVGLGERWKFDYAVGINQ